MKRQKTIRRTELLKDLNMLERKFKFRKQWDERVKEAFQITGTYSFEELVLRDENVAMKLKDSFQ